MLMFMTLRHIVAELSDTNKCIISFLSHLDAKYEKWKKDGNESMREQKVQSASLTQL